MGQHSGTESIDLSPYDRKHFVDELNDTLDGVTEFRGTMDTLEHNPGIRRFVIAEYILGIGLRLHLERLQLLLKQEKEPLDRHDIEAVRGMALRYENTLRKTEEDFLKLRQEILSKYPLADSKNIYDEGQRPGEIHAYVPPQPELEKLITGINMKYLKGDRWLIRKTCKSLKEMVGQIDALNMNSQPA
jgi:hypothetical protein